ncbi:hypothetical protein GH714_035366 [Hevea brasiliensis]|uniref:Helicase MOV-10-like beta-barrel domain-containing protein n=1 Tax=Hevea brasiliensis TaxID=3981 RepID=A0A6A6L7B9_HEVBR|nr:hypothetical protein GH714_035366 [Hevea brasiliensis]
MSLFLEILRCVLCCVEDRRDENDDETYCVNTSWEPRVSRSIVPFNFRAIFGSRSSNSAKNGSAYVNSVERIYDVSSSSKSYRNYVPISSHIPEASSSWLPQSPSKEAAYSSSPTPRTKPPASSSYQPQSVTRDITSSKPSLLSPAPSISSKSSHQAPKLPLSSNQAQPLIPEIPSSKPSPVSLTAPTSSLKPSPQAPSTSSKPSPLFSVTTASSSKTNPKAPPSSLGPSASSSKPPPTFKPTLTPASAYVIKSSQKPPIPEFQKSYSEPSPSPSEPLPSFKPTLAPASSSVTSQQTKANYVLVQKGTSPIYMIPKDIKDLIKNDRVPGVLKKPLSMSTYKDYFAALLYAEDFYIEKWSEFKLENITLKLQQASIFKLSYFTENHEKDNKTFVTFEIDSCREKRPFLLSRDFIFARPSGNKTEPFQGVIYRVVRSTTVLVEFGEDFYAQHHPSRRYDVSFSFNRVCLKRAHQAVEAASDPLFKSEFFSCPRLQELRKYRVILSTYVSSFRLHNEGIAAGHFSHIFLVDASSATEPEAMVALANLANEKTAVIVTGAPGNHSGWVRSDIARKNGLMDSYFERLRKRNPYNRLDSMFITKLKAYMSQFLEILRCVLCCVDDHRDENDDETYCHLLRNLILKPPSSLGPSASSSKPPLTFKPTLTPASAYVMKSSQKPPTPEFQKSYSEPSPSPSEPLPSFKPTVAPASSSVTSQQTKANHVLVQKKWSKFKLENITLKLQQVSIFKLSCFTENHEKDNKTFVTFEIDSCRERRPFLLSRDFAFARPSGNKTEPFQELQKHRVILSTYVSTFWLCNEGIAVGHFSHIFLVDASSATEPEAMVALANLANEKTAVIVTGAPANHSGWVRSDIAGKNELMDSYFERLRKRNPYNRLDSMFITKLVSVKRKSDDIDSF